MSGINQLFGPSRVQGIEPVEQRRKADSVFAPLGELAAGGRAVALIRASRLEWVAATRTHDAYTKRAHAFWRHPVSWLRAGVHPEATRPATLPAGLPEARGA